jgi:hypothetical protein
MCSYRYKQSGLTACTSSDANTASNLDHVNREVGSSGTSYPVPSTATVTTTALPGVSSSSTSAFDSIAAAVKCAAASPAANDSASDTQTPEGSASETVRYSTKAYTVFEPTKKDMLVPNVLECVQHIRHFGTDIRVGDRVTVDAGPHRSHLSGQFIVAAIALHSIPKSRYPRIDAVLFDPTKPTTLHSPPMSVIKSVDGTATTSERVIITPLLIQWSAQQRQRAASAAADAHSVSAGAGGGVDGCTVAATLSQDDDDGSYVASTESSRRSTRKPTRVDRYVADSSSSRSVRKIKRKSTVSNAAVAAGNMSDTDSDSLATPAVSKRRRRPPNRTASTVAAAAAAASSSAKQTDTVNTIMSAAAVVQSVSFSCS